MLNQNPKIVVILIITLIVVSCSGNSRAFSSRKSSEDNFADISSEGSEEESLSDETRAELEALGYLTGSDDSGMLMVAQNPEMAEEPDSVDEESEEIVEQEDIPDADQEQDAETDSEDSESHLIEGQTLVAGEGMVPTGWPSDVTIPQDFEVRYGSADQQGLRVIAIGVGSLDNTRNFYSTWDTWNVSDTVEPFIEEDPGSGESITKMILFLTRESEFLVIDIVQQADDSIIQLKYTTE